MLRQMSCTKMPVLRGVASQGQEGFPCMKPCVPISALEEEQSPKPHICDGGQRGPGVPPPPLPPSPGPTASQCCAATGPA